MSSIGVELYLKAACDIISHLYNPSGQLYQQIENIVYMNVIVMLLEGKLDFSYKFQVLDNAITENVQINIRYEFYSGKVKNVDSSNVTLSGQFIRELLHGNDFWIPSNGKNYFILNYFSLILCISPYITNRCYGNCLLLFVSVVTSD